jgi:hypothetical protein
MMATYDGGVQAAETRSKERQWLRNQSAGDMDDTKLVRLLLCALRMRLCFHDRCLHRSISHFRTHSLPPSISLSLSFRLMFTTIVTCWLQVDGVAGEKLIFMRRGLPTLNPNAPVAKPTRLHFVLDCSGSMYRFNGLVRCPFHDAAVPHVMLCCARARVDANVRVCG